MRDPLRTAARERPEAVALEEDPGPDGGRWSYRQLDGASQEIALRLAAAGIRRGDRVAFLLGRGAAAVAALHGVPRTGASVAPLHTSWTEPELEDFLARLRPRALLCEAGTEERAASLVGSSGLLVRLGSTPSGEAGDDGSGAGDDGSGAGDRGPALALGELPGPGERVTLPGPDPDAEHTIIATSGSSGRARGVALSLTNHLSCQRACAERMELGAEDRWLASLSVAHVGGVALILRAALSGARLVVREGFEAGAFLELAEEGAVTHASLVPTMLRRVLREWGDRPAPGALRGVLVGGDAADPDTLRWALERGWPLHPTYGMTEAASQVATATPAEAREHPASVGRPLAGVEIGFEGDEILVRGPTVALGRLGEARAPGAVVREGRLIPRQGEPEPADRDPGASGGLRRGSGLEPVTDEAGWLHTGDAGRRDPEGRLFVTGRLSERLVTGGVTVDPSEVERVLRAHPEVREACVVGMPDREWGERVVAAVVRDPDSPEADPGDPVDESDLALWFGERLAVPKRPRAVRFVDRIPTSPNGKHDREAVRSLFERPGTRSGPEG